MGLQTRLETKSLLVMLHPCEMERS